MVITALTRNQVTGNRPWVRIPPPPLTQKAPLAGAFFVGLGGGIIDFSSLKAPEAYGRSPTLTRRAKRLFSRRVVSSCRASFSARAYFTLSGAWWAATDR